MGIIWKKKVYLKKKPFFKWPDNKISKPTDPNGTGMDWTWMKGLGKEYASTELIPPFILIKEYISSFLPLRAVFITLLVLLPNGFSRCSELDITMKRHS